MISTLKRLAFVTATGLLLSACVLIHTTKQEILYSPEFVAYIGQDGSLPVEISGNPLGNSDMANKKLLDAILLPHWIIPRRLVPVAPVDRGKSYRLVLVFNPASPIASGDSICADPQTKTRAPGPKMKVLAALCSSDDNVTRATAEGETAAGLNDPRFIDLLNDLIRATLPQRNEELGTTDCQASPCG